MSVVSRLIPEATDVSTVLLIAGFLLGFRAICYGAQRMGSAGSRVLVLGTGPLAGKIIEEIEARPDLGYTVVGVVDAGMASTEAFGYPILGPLEHLDRVIQEEKGHVGFGEQKLEEMVQTKEGKEQVQEAMNKYYIWALDMFGKSKSSRNDRYLYWRIKRRHNDEARQEYIREVDPLIKDLGLQVPDKLNGRKFL